MEQVYRSLTLVAAKNTEVLVCGRSFHASIGYIELGVNQN